MSKFEIAHLADGKRTATEIAEIMGVTRRYVRKVATRDGLDIPLGEIYRTPSSIDVERFRALAAAGRNADEIAAAFNLSPKTIANFGRKHGIPLAARRRKAARRAPPPDRQHTPTASVEEWIARNGAPRRFESGTLDQLLADTFAAVGKTLTYSAGKGTSWTPYRLGGRNLNRAQVIAAANKIRAEQGKPLFSEPRRQSQSAAWGKDRAA